MGLLGRTGCLCTFSLHAKCRPVAIPPAQQMEQLSNDVHNATNENKKLQAGIAEAEEVSS